MTLSVVPELLRRGLNDRITRAWERRDRYWRGHNHSVPGDGLRGSAVPDSGAGEARKPKGYCLPNLAAGARHVAGTSPPPDNTATEEARVSSAGRSRHHPFG